MTCKYNISKFIIPTFISYDEMEKCVNEYSSTKNIQIDTIFDKTFKVPLGESKNVTLIVNIPDLINSNDKYNVNMRLTIPGTKKNVDVSIQNTTFLYMTRIYITTKWVHLHDNVYRQLNKPIGDMAKELTKYQYFNMISGTTYISLLNKFIPHGKYVDEGCVDIWRIMNKLDCNLPEFSNWDESESEYKNFNNMLKELYPDCVRGCYIETQNYVYIYDGDKFRCTRTLENDNSHTIPKDLMVINEFSLDHWIHIGNGEKIYAWADLHKYEFRVIYNNIPSNDNNLVYEALDKYSLDIFYDLPLNETLYSTSALIEFTASRPNGITGNKYYIIAFGYDSDSLSEINIRTALFSKKRKFLINTANSIIACDSIDIYKGVLTRCYYNNILGKEMFRNFPMINKEDYDCNEDVESNISEIDYDDDNIDEVEKIIKKIKI